MNEYGTSIIYIHLEIMSLSVARGTYFCERWPQAPEPLEPLGRRIVQLPGGKTPKIHRLPCKNWSILDTQTDND